FLGNYSLPLPGPSSSGSSLPWSGPSSNNNEDNQVEEDTIGHLQQEAITFYGKVTEEFSNIVGNNDVEDMDTRGYETNKRSHAESRESEAAGKQRKLHPEYYKAFMDSIKTPVWLKGKLQKLYKTDEHRNEVVCDFLNYISQFIIDKDPKKKAELDLVGPNDVWVKIETEIMAMFQEKTTSTRRGTQDAREKFQELMQSYHFPLK
ncbi:MAG: hypothetical protein ACRCZI_14110, partial [Cetobacterium sp.]